MEFDAIEALNEEELNSLYENAINNQDNRLSVCSCKDSSGRQTIEMGFILGEGFLKSSNCVEMFNRGVTDYNSCVQKCHSLGFQLNFWFEWCDCPNGFRHGSCAYYFGGWCMGTEWWRCSI